MRANFREKMVVLVVALLLSVLTVSADLTADIRLNTTGDVTSDTHLSTDGGDINYNSEVYSGGDYNFNAYWYNGTGDFDVTQRYDNAYYSGITWSTFASKLRRSAEIMYYGESRSGSKYINRHIREIIDSLSLLFLTRPEAQSLQSDNKNLEHRLEVVERTLQKIHPKEYCESKLEVMEMYGYDEVNCMGVEYRKEVNEIVGVKKIR